jgi:hypothetical protein
MSGLIPTGRKNRARNIEKDGGMKGILLWLIGVPIPVIILLYLFGVMR